MKDELAVMVGAMDPGTSWDFSETWYSLLPPRATHTKFSYFYPYNHGRPIIIMAVKYHHPPPPPTNSTHRRTRHRMQIYLVHWFFIWRPGWIDTGHAPYLPRRSTADRHQLHAVFDQRQKRRPAKLPTQQFTSSIAILMSCYVMRALVSFIQRSSIDENKHSEVSRSVLYILGIGLSKN